MKKHLHPHTNCALRDHTPSIVPLHTGVEFPSAFEHYLRQNILRKAPLRPLAEECNMSLSTFKANFAKVFGTSPHRWFVRERLSLARTLLITTNTQVKTIAYECGFGSPSQFIRLFHKHFGLPPAHYRALFGGVATIDKLEKLRLDY